MPKAIDDFTIVLPELTDMAARELKIYDGLDQLVRMVDGYKMTAPIAIRVVDNKARSVRALRGQCTVQIPDRPAAFTDFLQFGSHFIIQFRNAKEQPSFLMLHSPSLRLTIHIPSHSEEAERVSQLPLMCPVLACVTMP